MEVGIEKPDFAEYDDLLMHNDSTFYQSSSHLRFLEKILKNKTQFITVRDDKRLKGALPFFIKESRYGKVINSLPFFGSYGGLIAEDLETKKKIILFLNEYNKNDDILASVVVSNPFSNDWHIYEKYFLFNKKEERLAQCLKIDGLDYNATWLKFEQRVRRAVRKAEKNQLVIKREELTDNELKGFCDLHIHNIGEKGGKTKPPDFFFNLKEFFKIDSNYDVFSCSKNNTTIAYLLVFYFKNFTEYYMPAYDLKFSDLQPTSLLIWESIKKSIDKKKLLYNFGGTCKNQKSLYRFKKGWDCDDYSYGYYIYRDLSRLREIEIDELKHHYDNFYISPYSEIGENP